MCSITCIPTKQPDARPITEIAAWTTQRTHACGHAHVRQAMRRERKGKKRFIMRLQRQTNSHELSLRSHWWV